MLAVGDHRPAYLAGYLGTAYVPGRLSTSNIVFAASIPNLAVATTVFALLAALIVLAHFRPGKGTEFTLVNVAAAVHQSELPALFAGAGKAGGDGRASYTPVDAEVEGELGTLGQSRVRFGGDHALDRQQTITDMGQRRVYMQKRGDGSVVLHID